MKIHIKEAGGKAITIPVPMGIVEFGLYNSKLMTLMAKKHIDKKAMKYIQCVDFNMLARNFHMLKKYKGMTIVEVKSGDGDEVSIVI